MCAHFGRYERQCLVDAQHPLHVNRQRIKKDIGQCMPRNLRETRVGAGGARRCVALGFVHAARTNHKNALCAQVNGWGERR